MTDLERVARAICAEMGYDPDELPSGECREPGRDAVVGLLEATMSDYRRGYAIALEAAARLVESQTSTAWGDYKLTPNAARRIAREVRNLPLPDAPDGWQPISTAPKDGTEFLAWGAAFGQMRTVEWNARFYAWESWEGTHSDNAFTHWMPLPAPPAPEEK